MRVIDGTAVQLFISEPFMAWCHLLAPETEKEPFSQFMQQLFDRGNAFEISYQATIAGIKHEDVPRNEAGFERTIALMKEGAEAIANMPLVDKNENLLGMPDVLLKRDTHKSVFGRWHYIVHEVKLSSEPKPEQVMQAAFYNKLLGVAQGYTPRHFFLVTRNADGTAATHKYDWLQHEKPLEDALTTLRRMLEGKFMPRPNVKACDEPWTAFCKKKAIEADDMSLVANCGNDKQRPLEKEGITTVTQLAALAKPIDGIADTKLEQLKTCARAFLEKRFIILQDVRIPSGKTEYYLDFEGVEQDGEKFDYLIGILERTGSKTSFHPFIARTRDEHKKVVQDAVAFLNKHPDAPIFHYAPYEKGALKLIGESFGIDVKPLLHRMTDILQVMRRCVAPPTSTFTLKDIAKALGFTWRAGMDAGQSMVLFAKAADATAQSTALTKKETDALVQKILDYNEDDVRALLLLKQTLEKHTQQGDSWNP